MTITRLPAAAVESVARQLDIVDQVTGATLRWDPHAEQRRVWRDLAKHPWVFFAKPRRIGATTAVELDDMLFCKVNDERRHRVRAGFFTDSDKKLNEQVELARSWVAQLPGLFKGVDVNHERIRFPYGSILEFGTGSGKAVGRGGGFHRIHITELPFWLNPQAYGALLPSMTAQCQVIIETTIDVAAPSGELVQKIWKNPHTRFERVFFSVEEHGDYRVAADQITDEQWTWAQGEGFKDREAAAWWLTVALEKCGGDTHRLMREFPQTQTHMLALAEGLWVKGYSEVIAPVSVVDIEGHQLEVYKRLPQTSGQIVVAVDVAKGAGADSSVIAVIDKRDGALCAMLHDNNILTTTLARATKVAHDLYTTPAKGFYDDEDDHPIRPDVVYETNGVGTGPMQYARELGMAVIDVHLSGAEGASIIYDCLLLAKQAVEAGVLKGPQALSDECGVLTRDPVTGKWKGRKDGLIAYGHARRWCRVSPYRHAPIAPNPNKIDGQAIIRGRTQNASEW